MRPRFLIYLSTLVLVVLTIMFWLRPKQGLTVSTPIPTQKTIQPTNQPPPSNVAIVSQNVSRSPLPINQPANQQELVTHKTETPEQARQEIESANAPIEFYGKVIDQDSNALAGAKIKIGIRHWYMVEPSLLPAGSDMMAGGKEIYQEQISDASGGFEFHGETGDGFGVGITKDGYELEPNRYGFGPTAGSYGNPVVFKMWSTNIHQKLIGGNKSFDIVPDGRAYFINLTDDTISESGTGDLKIWIQYTNQITQGQLYDWSAEIDVINGGLLEVPLGTAMFEAPTDGYTPSYQSHQQIKGGQRGSTGEHQYYLQLKNGQEYGQMSIGLYAPFNDQTPGLVRLSYAINPSGSRILR